MLLKYQSFRFVPSIPCVKCTCITFAIANNILAQIYQITIIWNNLSSVILNNQAQKKAAAAAIHSPTRINHVSPM